MKSPSRPTKKTPAVTYSGDKHNNPFPEPHNAAVSKRALPQPQSTKKRSQTSSSALRHARQDLNAPVRLASRILHRPYIEVAGDSLAATIARPIGILFGGIFALIGFIIALIIASRYGYEFNYLFPVAGYFIGYILGCLVEFALSLLKPKS